MHSLTNRGSVTGMGNLRRFNQRKNGKETLPSAKSLLKKSSKTARFKKQIESCQKMSEKSRPPEPPRMLSSFFGKRRYLSAQMIAEKFHTDRRARTPASGLLLS